MGIIKWVGGKAREAKTIVSYFPDKDTIDIYSEPFVGAGSCLLEYKPSKFICSDINPKLISIYKGLQHYPDKFIFNLLTLINNYHRSSDRESFYYSVRESLNKDSFKNYNFYFLLLFGYNGLCRFNSEGNFNVPWGKDKHYYDLDKLKEKLLDIGSFLSSKEALFYMANYICGPITRNNFTLTPDSFIYFDPPYDATFNQYDKSLVQSFDQKELFNTLTKKDYHPYASYKWLMTNSGTDYIRNLYKDFNIIELPTKRVIGPKESRVSVNDVIIKNY